MTEPTSPPVVPDIRMLLTAEQAFPEFEKAVLSAKRRIVGGFRIFDPLTKLRSDEGREIGDDWFDLLLHVAGRGVAIDLLITDFDPIVTADLHMQTWANMRKLWAMAELAGSEARIRMLPGMHAARMGAVPATAFWPIVGREISEVIEWLNAYDAETRKATFRNMPGIWRWLRIGEDGVVEQHTGGPYPLFPVTHHQKLAVIDGELLYIGGLDLNPRRYDTIDHRRRGEQTWHDVQLMVRGPAARSAEIHLDTLSEVISGARPPAEEEHGFKTTISRGRGSAPFSISPVSISKSIDAEIRSRSADCADLIYFETQFFRDHPLADHLAALGREKPDLQLLMVLPAAPDVVAFEDHNKIDARFGEHLQVGCVDKVRAAFGERCYFASPAQRRSVAPGEELGRGALHGAPIIYVHAKLCIFDRASVLVSSANLNGRSLHWDTEAGIVHDAAPFARDALQRCIDHWLPGAQIAQSADLVDRVRAQAELDALRQPENRDGFLLPYDLETARAFGKPIPGFPNEMV